MNQRVTVVLSQGPSNAPPKRHREASLASRLAKLQGVDVVLIPHLYDLPSNSPTLLPLRNLSGSFLVLSWLYPRAAHWLLDRHGIRGNLGGGSPTSEPASKGNEPEPAVLARRSPPARTIYHFDLRQVTDLETCLAQLQEWITACTIRLISLPNPPPTPHTPPSSPAPKSVGSAGAAGKSPASESNLARRWYPVIDYSRCTNCLECIDFCLFGVYGIDHQETILVEQPDACRRGCPACSRVCPAQAIMFPQHKSPAIAGDANATADGLKLNLSQLFGGPEAAPSTALEQADRERAAHLTADNQLDALVDELDQLDL